MVVSGVATAAAQTPEQLLGQDKTDISGRTSLTLGSGARAFGMGGAFLARADDATAASWNPAGLSYLRVPEVSLAGNRTLYRKESGTSPDLNVDRFEGQTVEFAAFTFPLRLRGLSGAIQASFQRAVPFGGTLRKVEQRTGDREAVVSTGEASGGFDVFAFGTGWRVTRTLRTGITVNRWFNGYTQTLDRNVPDSDRLRVFDTNFGLRGWNVNLGAIWSPIEEVNLGAVFKTPFTGQVSLDKTRTDIPLAGGQRTAYSYQSHDVRLQFPAAFGFGTSWRPRSALTLSADFTRTFWSRSRLNNFFTLRFNPPSTAFYAPLPYPALDQAQSDTDQIRAGLEYVVIGSRVKVPLRAGYFNDEQIVRAAGGTSPRFNGFTAGIGVILGPILFDVAYLFESGRFVETVASEATAELPASTTQVSTSLRTERFFVSLIYRIGGSN